MLINNSRLDKFMKCPRAYYWEYERNLVSQSGAGDLQRGIILHEGLAAMYNGGSIRDVEGAMVAKAAEYMPEHPLPAQVHAVKEALEWYSRILTAYYQRVYLKEAFEVKAVEVSFITTLGDICYACGTPYVHAKCEYRDIECPECGADVHWLMGRADLITKEKNIHRIVDHKTTKGAGSNYLNAWAFTFAQLGYVYAVKRCTEWPVTGYNVNVIKMLKGIGTNTEKGDPFIRQSFTVTPENLDRMLHNRVTLIGQIKEQKEVLSYSPTIAADQFPMCDNSCRMGCPYTGLCWNGNTLHWDTPSAMKLAQFDERQEDYVDELRNKGHDHSNA